ncbi:ABC-type glycine betaine transport, permease [Leifsonia xyli subsp. cynodontis DSM 46306]|jgi:ABC-type proline/glycine betaine transport system permease subunit|uniref:Uncharacterized protein n=1 Tax=Leifsonia xyli subsp. cynodontis DSM 46306 TaxID=1389489 RepID=U3P7N5_LEIXC|nr:ABC-type glycine betaine transport, permease [Leifsonia xyli]AGW41841.1 ABC-type glycine betaine transport, permease [Leifsonia xyli subsp. cynodontis DSM 46306]
MSLRLPLGDVASRAVDVVTVALGGLFDAVRAVFAGLYAGVDWPLQTPPLWGVILLFAILGVWLRGWVFGAGTVAGLLLIASVDQWANAMDTLALVLVSAALLSSLENALFNSGADARGYDRIVEKWMSEHADYVRSLTD